MSEHQVYDFRCVDSMLDAAQKRELRAISTRATITSVSFHNTYQWGDLKGDPRVMLVDHFDAFFYLTNWGSRWVMFKFPAALVPSEALEPYALSECLEVWEDEGHTILELHAMNEEGYFDEWWEYEESLDTLIELRADIMAGDHRALFVFWLGSIASTGLEWWDLDEGTALPPLPAGLDALTPPYDHLSGLFELDRDAVTAAAERGPSGPAGEATSRPIEEVLSALSPARKDALLTRVAAGDASVRAELLAATRPTDEAPPLAHADLVAILERAKQVRAERERELIARRERERAEKVRLEAERRRAYLEGLVTSWDATWDTIYGSIDEGNRGAYADAARLMADLLEVIEEGPRRAEILTRVAELRDLYPRRYALQQELTQAGLP
jgi:hypothetical protein